VYETVSFQLLVINNVSACIFTLPDDGFPQKSKHVAANVVFDGLYSLSAVLICHICLSQWPRVLRRESAAVRLLRLRVRIPPGACNICLL